MITQCLFNLSLPFFFIINQLRLRDSRRQFEADVMQKDLLLLPRSFDGLETKEPKLAQSQENFLVHGGVHGINSHGDSLISSLQLKETLIPILQLLEEMEVLKLHQNLLIGLMQPIIIDEVTNLRVEGSHQEK